MERFLVYMMFLSVVLFSDCSEKNKDFIPVGSLDQIAGIWKWESTCGGLILNCSYPSGSNRAALVLTQNGEYIEYLNDTISIQTVYSIEKTDDTHGTLTLGGSYHNLYYCLPISIDTNHLGINWGEMQKSYIRIK